MKKFILRLRAGLKAQLQQRGEKIVNSKATKLSELPFFDALFLGHKNHPYKKWKNPSRTLYCHGSVTITVNRNGRLAGMISFEVIGPFMVVKQIQSAKGADFFDKLVTPQAYFFECLETIAETLGFKSVFVETPERVLSEMESWGKKEIEPEIKQTIRRIYGQASAVGYGRKYFWPLARVLQFKPLRST